MAQIAYDKFAQSVAEPGRPLGYLFLDKLFQLRVPVPSIGDDRQQDYLRQLLGVRDIRSGSYPLAEEQAVRERLRRSSTEAEIIEILRQASPQIRERLASSAVKGATDVPVGALS